MQMFIGWIEKFIAIFKFIDSVIYNLAAATTKPIGVGMNDNVKTVEAYWKLVIV